MWREGAVAMMRKVPLGIDVLTAAKQRIAWTFERFERVTVAFSGGKDSTVLLHLAAQHARGTGRQLDVMFIDWEAQYEMTIRHVEDMLDEYADVLHVHWICLPLRTTNACSMIEPEWVCWEPEKAALWVRQIPGRADVISDPAALPFYVDRMTFEEFIEEMGAYLGGAVMVGIRTNESLNRFRAIASDAKVNMVDGKAWTTDFGEYASAYPIYDWATEDVWTYFGRTGDSYNLLYDRMHQAGVSIHKARLCEPYGDEQRQGLWLFHLLEPHTWPKVAARVAGANTGALYAGERGNVLGNHSITLPQGHTWESFANHLLDTMPHGTAEHYRDKIAVYVRWWAVHGGLPEGLPDEQPGDTGGKDVASWRRVCKMLLKNDYWATTLKFSPTKTSGQDAYRDLMRRRRNKWGIYAD